VADVVLSAFSMYFNFKLIFFKYCQWTESDNVGYISF